MIILVKAVNSASSFVLFCNCKRKTSKKEVTVIFSQVACFEKSCVFGLMCVSFVNVYQSICSSVPICFEDGMWDLNVLIPDHCLSIYFTRYTNTLFRHKRLHHTATYLLTLRW